MQRTNGPHRFESPPGGFRPLPDREAEAKATRARRMQVGLFSIGAIAVLSFTVMWNPPTGGVHSFTKASDYVASKDSGCTNSGEGCHGDETSYTDFNAYHADTDCTGCHDYQGVGCIPCHSPSGHECQSCHDGTVETAGDRNRITDPYPKGHYRETTHTAMGTDMKAEMRSTESGEATATCGTCHSRDLMESHQKVPEIKGSEYGDSVGCGECHNDERAFGLKQVKEDWKERRCEDCHTPKSSAPMHEIEYTAAVEASDTAGCGSTGVGCHDQTDLHALHPDTPKDCSGAGIDGERPCHDLTKQAHQPAEKRCGVGGRSCHPGYESDEYTHDKDADLHRASLALATSTLFDEESGVSTRCISCHSVELTDEHSRASSALGGGVCTACHNRNDTTAGVVLADWPSRGSANACRDCHGTSGVSQPHGAMNAVHEGIQLDEAGRPGENCSGEVCHDATDVRTLHAETGCTTDGCHQPGGDINGRSLVSCGGTASDDGCHVGYSTFAGHKTIAGVHSGIEIGTTGETEPGACVSAGCHVTVDLADLHRAGCEIDGCHRDGERPQKKTCGGPGAEPCHTGFSAGEHFADHRADRTGTVRGITYRPGENSGCFGCHSASLYTEHTGDEDAGITGGGASNCRVCHDDPRDGGNGAYAGLRAVRSAIERGDVRCVSCHASGSSKPGRTAAASAHKRTTTATPRPAGYVWADPLDAWKAAMESPVGGGHNVIDADVAGAGTTRLFPVTEYSVGALTYRWELPPNRGDTAWLKPIDGEALDTEDEITHAMIGCQDCHVLPDEMAGPHGSAVEVLIDPEYSQTEYANPTRGLESQFDASGTKRVICMKCHRMSFDSVEGSDMPGGNPVHAQHARHSGAPAHHPLRYGEKCVDCHVRIPHASRSARLLVRTIEGPGRPADAFPYVANDHDGLAGVRLRSFTRPEDLTKAACLTGGCHGSHSSSNHPERSDVPTAPLWP